MRRAAAPVPNLAACSHPTASSPPLRRLEYLQVSAVYQVAWLPRIGRQSGRRAGSSAGRHVATAALSPLPHYAALPLDKATHLR